MSLQTMALCLHNTGGISQVHGFTADQMRAYAQAALNARAGGDGWRAIRALAWRYEEVEASEFDEHGDAAIAEAALASQHNQENT